MNFRLLHDPYQDFRNAYDYALQVWKLLERSKILKFSNILKKFY